MELLSIQGLKRATVVKRLNRFVVSAITERGEDRLHTRNTGRLLDLLYPGSAILYEERRGDKTSGLIVGVEIDGKAALIDPAIQALAFEQAARLGALTWLGDRKIERREVSFYGSRLDYAVKGPASRGYLELKSAVFYSSDGFCMYPDTRSERGLRHVRTLIRAKRRGREAIIVFIAAHPRCLGFRPCAEADIDVARALREAAASGVEIYSVKMHLELAGQVVLDSPSLPVRLE